MSDFYIRYSYNTLVADMLSGSKIVDVPAGYATAPVKEEIGLAFMNVEKQLHQYSVSVVDGYAEFSPLWEVRQFHLPDNVVRDLSYNTFFFDNFNITFEYIDSMLTLNLDLDSIKPHYRNTYNTFVTDQNQTSYIYVTEFQDPTQLIDKFKINLLQLKKEKTIKLELTTEKKISVWIANE